MATARKKAGLPTRFEFEEGEQRFSCNTDAPASPASARSAHWWWFEVAGDGNRYAPFKASEDDTEDSVRQRIVSYYNEHLARRREPARPFGGRRPERPSGVATAPAADATPAE